MSTYATSIHSLNLIGQELSRKNTTLYMDTSTFGIVNRYRSTRGGVARTRCGEQLAVVSKPTHCLLLLGGDVGSVVVSGQGGALLVVASGGIHRFLDDVRQLLGGLHLRRLGCGHRDRACNSIPSLRSTPTSRGASGQKCFFPEDELTSGTLLREMFLT